VKEKKKKWLLEGWLLGENSGRGRGKCRVMGDEYTQSTLYICIYIYIYENTIMKPT
jgi:hypothetical protein